MGEGKRGSSPGPKGKRKRPPGSKGKRQATRPRVRTQERNDLSSEHPQPPIYYPISPTKVRLEVEGGGGKEREKGKLPGPKRENGKGAPASFEIQFH